MLALWERRSYYGPVWDCRLFEMLNFLRKSYKKIHDVVLQPPWEGVYISVWVVNLPLSGDIISK